MAAGGEWPDGWGGLVPSLLGQLVLAAAAVAQEREGAGGGDVVRGGAGLGTHGGDAGRSGGGGEGREGAGGPAATAVENAVARAESCAKCLQYMTEEVCTISETCTKACFSSRSKTREHVEIFRLVCMRAAFDACAQKDHSLLAGEGKGTALLSCIESMYGEDASFCRLICRVVWL